MSGPAVRFVASGGTPAVESDFGAPITETVSGAPFTLVDKGGVNVRGPARYRVGADNPKLVLDFANGIYRNAGATVGGFSDVVDFTRTGLATVTDSDGKVKWAPHNLVSHSEDFENAAWVKIRASVTGSAIASPDGAVTAGKFTEDTQTGGHSIEVEFSAVSGATYVCAVFLKAAERSFAQVSFVGSPNAVATFDLANGTVSEDTDGDLVSASIEDFGDGWYLCSVQTVATATAAADLRIGLSDTGTPGGFSSYTGDGSSGIYLWGAHLYRSDLGGMQDVPNEERKVSATYLPTTTAARYLPRFNHNPVTLAPLGLLVGESQTNLLPYSEDFSNAAWTKLRVTITSNATISPDGTQNADKLVEDSTASANRYINDSVTVVAGETSTFSVYAKADERSAVFLVLDNGTSSHQVRCSYDLLNENTSSVSYIGNGSEGKATIEDVGEGWKRIRLTGLPEATSTTHRAWIFLENPFGTNSYDGDGTSGVFIWGAQLEAGSFPTSYIPTTGSAATRAVERAEITGSKFTDFFNETQGTLIFEADILSDAGFLWHISDGTTANDIRVYLNSGSQLVTRVRDGGVDQVNSGFGSAGFAPVDGAKIAVSWAENDVSSCVNGGTVITDSSATIPTGLNELVIGSLTITDPTAFNFKSVRYFPVALTDAQLQEATS